MTWVAAGTAVVGTAASIYGNNKAAGQQGAGANAANALLQQQYQTNVANNAPYVAGGTSAENALLGRLGLGGTNGTAASGYGTLGQVPTSADVMATPGYQFGLDQGQNQLTKQLNASGQSYSGAALKAADQYGTDYATGKYQQAFNNLEAGDQQVYSQLSGVAGMGQNAINSDNQSGSQYAGAAANNITGAASANSAATLGDANATNNLINQGTSIYKNYSTPATANQGMNSNGSVVSNNSIYTDPSSLYGQNGSDVGFKFANGGPVGEPVVGTRTPLPQATGGGTGGGLSREAILQALMARPVLASTRTGTGALPVNPVMHPGLIDGAQMIQSGAYAHGGAVQMPMSMPHGQIQGPVHGPGTATSDSIPVPMQGGGMAHLSNGEHVFDVASVNAAGNGSNAAGQNKLNMLRAQLKGKANGA